ncbi:MAG: PLP-dependent aminotransferase family protein [Oscillospiraceae bacterium]
MIRTYELSHESKTPLYVQLYEAIRADILSGSLPGGEKLPSKRALAEHLSLSKITVETAYAQLLDEGYLTSRERSGYFVAHMPLLAKAPARYEPETAKAPEPEPQQNAAAELFPFSVWAKLMRSVILDEGQYLLQPVPNGGLLPLRLAIAEELARQRGLVVQPEQIVIGAGTEYFYALLAQFLGRGQRFAIEDPCHRTLAQVYSRSGAEVMPVPMDESGIRVAELEASGAQIVHVSPSHQYPTGTVMPITRRQELLAWMGRGEERFLIEDDYDSEFRFSGASDSDAAEPRYPRQSHLSQHLLQNHRSRASHQLHDSAAGAASRGGEAPWALQLRRAVVRAADADKVLGAAATLSAMSRG